MSFVKSLRASRPVVIEGLGFTHWILALSFCRVLILCFEVDCFSLWLKINKNNSLDIPEDMAMIFPANICALNFFGFEDIVWHLSIDCISQLFGIFEILHQTLDPSPHIVIVQGFIFINSLQFLVNVNRRLSFSKKEFNYCPLLYTDF